MDNNKSTREDIAAGVSDGISRWVRSAAIIVLLILGFHYYPSLALPVGVLGLAVVLVSFGAWVLRELAYRAGDAAIRRANARAVATKDPAYNKRFPKTELIVLATVFAGVLILGAVGLVNAH